jgi:hypothetical protein
MLSFKRPKTPTHKLRNGKASSASHGLDYGSSCSCQLLSQLHLPHLVPSRRDFVPKKDISGRFLGKQRVILPANHGPKSVIPRQKLFLPDSSEQESFVEGIVALAS